MPHNAVSHLGLYCLLREISSKYEIRFEITPVVPQNDRDNERQVHSVNDGCLFSEEKMLLKPLSRPKGNDSLVLRLRSLSMKE